MSSKGWSKPTDKPFRELINKEYNEDPICYCKRCLSIKIRTEDESRIDWDIIESNNTEEEECYCEDCGSTNIEMNGNIFEWEQMYMNLYGEYYLNNKD